MTEIYSDMIAKNPVNEKINVVESWAQSIMDDAKQAQSSLSNNDKIKTALKLGEIIGACESIITAMKASRNID